MSTHPGGFDPAAFAEPFSSAYRSHLQHLKLKGLQPKTIDAYARAIRRMGDYFDHQIDDLSQGQLTNYFSDLIASHSWSAVKLDLYGFKFYTLHVLGKPWAHAQLHQTTQGAALARYRHRRRSASPVCRYAGVELPGVLLHSLQHGLAPERRPGAEDQRH
jgi:hypothetical protein